MNYLKHSIMNMSKLVANAIAKGSVVCQECICDELDQDYNIIKATVYEKEDVGIYIADEIEWIDEDRTGCHTSGWSYLYAKGIPKDDLNKIMATAKQMLRTRR